MENGPHRARRPGRHPGRQRRHPSLVDTVFLPNVHDQVIAGAPRVAPDRDRRSGLRGVVWSTATVAATIEAADAGVKGARVELLELRLQGDGLGGKGYLLFDGSAVRRGGPARGSGRGSHLGPRVRLRGRASVPSADRPVIPQLHHEMRAPGA